MVLSVSWLVWSMFIHTYQFRLTIQLFTLAILNIQCNNKIGTSIPTGNANYIWFNQNCNIIRSKKMNILKERVEKSLKKGLK
jgi:hypothetical protein